MEIPLTESSTLPKATVLSPSQLRKVSYSRNANATIGQEV